jgi:hypothetical protein
MVEAQKRCDGEVNWTRRSDPAQRARRMHVQPKSGTRQAGSTLQSEVKAWVSALSAKRTPTQ